MGTRSVLFGAHAFWLHPWFVAAAWTRLYGFPWDIKLWVAFWVHDLGYVGARSMDDEEGERHVLLGARIMHRLFDRPRVLEFESSEPVPGYPPGFVRVRRWQFVNRTWFNFTAYHSRFWARREGAKFSRLCVADKLASALEPWWLYLPRVILSGEIREYMATAPGQPGSKYGGEPEAVRPEEYAGLSPRRAWHRKVSLYLERWAYAHKDGGEDTWTPGPAKEAA